MLCRDTSAGRTAGLRRLKLLAVGDAAADILDNRAQRGKFAIDRMLPKVDVGDLLVIHDTGAHGFAMGYNYNGKLKSAEVLLKEDGSFAMIRRAETPRDYFATFDCFPIYKKIFEE